MSRTMQRPRRGQAALEYLVTYGWGILAVLVAIGALSYFGLFDVERYLPNRCAFGAQLECADYQLQASSDADYAGFISLRLRNNFGESITLTNAYVGDKEILPVNLLTDRAGDVPPIAAGNLSVPFRIDIPTANGIALVGDERQSITVTIEFQRTTPAGPKHNVTGELFGSVLEMSGSGPDIDPPVGG